ncbi:MAG: hypothetical protein LBG65_06155 [Puniceicoccales bacterium]|nr:hypothetical protein [Puniceicoccales bacterium]
MIWIYRILFLPALLFALPFYLPRMVRRGGYGRNWRQRFGAFPALPPKRAGIRRVWIQAVSVGEVAAVEPLVRELTRNGRTEVVLTTTTSTGHAVAKEKFAQTTLATGFFPVDFWLCSQKAWKRIQPDLAVLMEGELWPEHLWQAGRRGVPVALINARVSDASLRRYGRFRGFARMLFARIAAVGAGSREDARRLGQIGVPPEKISGTGNLKFEAGATSLRQMDEVEIRRWRARLGFGDAPDAPILLGSSTWPGEEALLLNVLKRAREAAIPLRLLLVPRHAERRAEISRLLEKTNWRWFLRSQHPDTAPNAADICVADTTGELSRLTALAKVAFIGKSLPPNNGGQSPIECAALGIPLVYGPCMTNFREACRGLELENAAICVPDATAAANTLLELLNSPEKRAILSQNARRWHSANQGATTATIHLLDSLFPEKR